jgi:hypothetical protein
MAALATMANASPLITVLGCMIEGNIRVSSAKDGDGNEAACILPPDKQYNTMRCSSI